LDLSVRSEPVSIFKIVLTLFLLLGPCFLLTKISRVEAADYYRGKTVRIVVGFAPGGGFDTYSRTIARHLGRHIPGSPNLVVSNLPGAGSVIAANQLYHRTPPDGLTIGNILGSLALSQLLSAPGIEFDARRFVWLGVPAKQDGACVLASASGITDVVKWQSSGTPVVKFASTGVGSLDYIMAKALQSVAGLPLQIVAGYKGTADARLAIESGEVAGGCWQWQPIKATWKNALDSGQVKVMLQFGSRSHSDLAHVPLARSLAKSDDGRMLLKIAAENPNLVTTAYALPPGSQGEHVAILRRAFSQTLQDRGFLEDAKKSSLEINPLTGEETEVLIGEIFNIHRDLVAQLRSLVQR